MNFDGQVKIWQEAVIIPTYPIGKPEKNPMFLEKRVYQGSSGVVYPHAVIEKIEDTPENKTYQACFLENKYLKIMVLPELGGRIQMAFDKVKQRHFIYYNQVVKPALVGLTGPWISGGIEFNWPQHHRPSTFEAIDFKLEENADGSKTVWVSEVERMFSTKGMAGFTLHPDKAYLEIKGVLYNRTALPQTFLWWANPAVKVNDHYQSVFPPDVYAVFDHGKRDVSSFPIAKGTYYKVDYSPGTDISGYKNIPVPTSYMAIKSKYDFMGGYEHDRGGGLLHVANHHISPGKKQWTWGNGEFGFAWDRNLTDEDGPYIELMTGVFTDNQPDFSWIMPNEERRFTQYFMPYSEIGVVKNATKNAALNLVDTEGGISIKAYATTLYKNATIELALNGKAIFSEKIDIAPDAVFQKELKIEVADWHQLRLTLYDETGKILVAYQPDVPAEVEMPEPALAAKQPQDVENNEQLYLTGLHIEQYRHATYSAKDYYEEALKRDKKDVRCNNALGLWYYKKGQFAKAKPYFEQAITTLIQRNPNPYDGEAYYNLGLCELKLNNLDTAYEAFYKATWNAAWQDAAFLQIARISTQLGNYETALEEVQKSLYRNWCGHNARYLKTVLLRKLGKHAEAEAFINESLAMDNFNFGCLFEKSILLKNTQPEAAQQAASELKTMLRGNVQTYLEYTFECLHAGFYAEANDLLSIYFSTIKDGEAYPIALYVKAFVASKLGDQAASNAYLQKAKTARPDFVFPNRLDELVVLEWATSVQSDDANAYYFKGNFWYANRQSDDAIRCWTKAATLNPQFPTVFRNLSLAYFNKLNNAERALQALETAFKLDKKDARVLMELDQLYKRLNHSNEKRLDLLLQDTETSYQRDDLYLEIITLHNQLGDYEKAKNLIEKRQFHPWEGGEGKVVGQYLICHIELAKQAIEASEPQKALDLLTAAETYPHNLGEGKLYGAQENDIHFLKGMAYENLGNNATAAAYFRKAIIGLDEPAQAIFYNDQQPDKIFYQGLAWQKLNETARAERIFQKLIDFGKAHQADEIKIDYFAVSLPDLLVFDVDLNERNRIHCLYLIGLGHLGLSHYGKATEYFNQVLDLNSSHQGAAIHKNMVDFLENAAVLMDK
jgi:tetratricopeptide (TPR) repeat protein